MSLYGAFDQTKHLSELGDPLETQGAGVLSAASRRLLAVRNLTGDSDIVLADFALLAGVTASAAELNYNDITRWEQGPPPRPLFSTVVKTTLGLQLAS